MICSSNYQKGVGILRERANSLSHEGYRVMFSVENGSIAFIKLVHPNGHIISLSYDGKKSCVNQSSNGRIVKSVEVR